jgi:enoyl-CoA hydratase/carnithine racemase
MSGGDIETHEEGAVLHIRMNRLDKKNALTHQMYAAMREALLRADTDPGIRAVLLQSAGETFAAGNDLQEFLSDPPRGEQSEVFRFLEAISALSKPIVAAVAGAAVGIGTTMLLHCDLVYAAENARFTLPFVGLGLCPEAGSSYLLPRLAGQARAAELLLLGETLDAAQAAALGLVSRVVPRSALAQTALAAAGRLAAAPPRAVRAAKRLMRGGTAQQVRAAMREEALTIAVLVESPEAKEAFSAFLEKRKPDFTQFS